MRSRRADFLFLSVLSLLCVGAALLSSDNLYHQDLFIYGQVAESVYKGGTLYQDIWIDKPPLSLFPFLLIQAFAGNSYLALQLGLALLLCFQAAYGYFFFQKRIDIRVGWSLYSRSSFPLRYLSLPGFQLSTLQISV